MRVVTLDPQQVPARAELLLGAELGHEAPGRPMFAWTGGADDEDAERVKVGAVLTRRLHVAEAVELPPGAEYGNPRQGTRERAAAAPIGSPLIVRTDIHTPEAHGWRVYRVAPDGGAIYDDWIDDDAANAQLALLQLRSAASKSPESALRNLAAADPARHSAGAVTRWLAEQDMAERRPARKPRTRAARRRWRRALARKDRHA